MERPDDVAAIMEDARVLSLGLDSLHGNSGHALGRL